MTHPGIAVMMVVGVGLGAVLYYFFASTPEQPQTNRRSRNGSRSDPNRTYCGYPGSTSPPNSRNRREDRCRSCRICLEDTDKDPPENAVRLVPCMHVFHKLCIEEWRINGAGEARQCCPICRDKIMGLEQL